MLYFQLKPVEYLLGSTARLGDIIVLGLLTQLKEVIIIILLISTVLGSDRRSELAPKLIASDWQSLSLTLTISPTLRLTLILPLTLSLTVILM